MRSPTSQKIEDSPPEMDDSFGRIETLNLAQARPKSITEADALVCLRAQSFDHACTIPASEYASMCRQFQGIESYIVLESPCYQATDVDIRYALQVDQHQRLIHATAKILKTLSIKHAAAEDSLFTVDLDFRIDLVVPAGERQGGSVGDYHHRELLVDIAYAEPQAATYLQRVSITVDG